MPINGDSNCAGQGMALFSEGQGDTISFMKLLILALAMLGAYAADRPVEQFQTKAGLVKITPVRHASLMIEAGGKVIQVDPWSQGNYDGLAAADLILRSEERR